MDPNLSFLLPLALKFCRAEGRGPRSLLLLCVAELLLRRPNSTVISSPRSLQLILAWLIFELSLFFQAGSNETVLLT